VLKQISDGAFGDRAELGALVATINNNNDNYLIGADFKAYISAHD